jgi:hypothetical protein
MARRRRSVVAAALGATLVLGVSLASASSRFFHSPTGNIQCEIEVPHKLPSSAYCQTTSPPRSVILHANGRMKTCHGGPGCIGNGPENATTLHYGATLRLRPYRCASSRRGVKCRAVKSGHGFFISRARLTRF